MPPVHPLHRSLPIHAKFITMKPTLAAALIAAFTTLSLGGLTLPVKAAPSLPSTNVAWQPAAADADIDRAFAEARARNKPVLLYWGASWCPPCNQLKATLFNRQDFAALSKSFIAVHVDGDRPGAQKLSTRFKVSGYPTVVLFTPQGQEITRLPGEADAPQVMAVLHSGLTGGRPVKAVLEDALSGQGSGKTLSAGDWKMLAFYSWDTDEQQLVPKADVPATLVRLAVASPTADADTTTRLWLKALAASDDGKGVKADDSLRARVMKVLADPLQARLHMDVLTHSADDIVRTLEPDEGGGTTAGMTVGVTAGMTAGMTSSVTADTAAGNPKGRVALLAAFETALKRLQADATLSRNDRMGALYARVLLARLDGPKDAVQVKLAEPLLKDVRDHVALADREITDGYERQAVITYAGALLGRAGLWAESDALLKANLARSHSPYYLMSQLGGNARRLGHNEEALRWYGLAFDKSEGPATRLEWGSRYLSALVDLSPQDAARIEKTAATLVAQAGRDRGAFEGRSVRSLQRMGSKLGSWNADGKRAATLSRLQTQLDAVCARTDAADGQRAACQALLKPAAKKSA